MKYGFVKVAAAVPTVRVADVDYNVLQIESLLAQAEGKGVDDHFNLFPLTAGDVNANGNGGGIVGLHVGRLQLRQPRRAVAAYNEQGSYAERLTAVEYPVKILFRMECVQMYQDLIRTRGQSEFLDTFVTLKRRETHGVVCYRSREAALRNSLEF